MEAICNHFFNGADPLDKKITWVDWDKVLAAKIKRGLGVSSFYALNRAFLLKWVWRFVSQDGSLWFRVVQALCGSMIVNHSTHMSSNWCLILRELHLLKEKGFDFLSHCHKRIGDGNNTRFWSNIWKGDRPLKEVFPRVFTLELDKEILVVEKVATSVDHSLRRPIRGGIEQQQRTDLALLMDYVSLSSSQDRWVCDLSGDEEFRVKEIRNYIDDMFLPMHPEPTRWLIRRGVTLESTNCPLCRSCEEDILHVLFRCDVARTVLPGQAALKAASGKVTKQEKACIENQHVFILFAFDTFGFLAPEAMELLSRVQRVMHNNVMTPRSTDVVFKRIGFAIQKGLAPQLIARLPSTTI
nr:hypothetical protein [Tanacetum cinerariifolium]